LNPICPYCRTEVGDSEGERKDCPGCGTPHHADCFAENGGCTVFGCANAPTDEAKVTVSGTDLMGNVVTRQAPAPVARPGISLGPGFTTFRAPVPGPDQPAPQAVPGASGAQPPPPPPMVGTGTAPPPQAGPGSQMQQPPSSLAAYYPALKPKARVIFVLLGLFFRGLRRAQFLRRLPEKRSGSALRNTINVFLWSINQLGVGHCRDLRDQSRR
jgi:hypothetical protein